MHLAETGLAAKAGRSFRSLKKMDVIMIAAGAGFIGLSYFYALVCDRL
ncbi:hypothetical protein [Pseudochrobactrum sp. HB0163]